MADDITLNQMSGGSVVATDEVNSKHYQYVKPAFGADGTATLVSSTNPLPVATLGNGQTNLLYRFLSDDGTTTGAKDATGNYSGAAEEFYVEPGPGEVFHIARLIVSIEDGAAFAVSEYGNMGVTLTNGVKVEVRSGSHAAPTTVLDLMDGLAVTSNGEWGCHNFDVSNLDWGAGNQMLLARWTFSATDGELRIDGDAGERLSVILEDDLSALIHHRFLVQGYIVS